MFQFDFDAIESAERAVQSIEAVVAKDASAPKEEKDTLRELCEVCVQLRHDIIYCQHELATCLKASDVETAQNALKGRMDAFEAEACLKSCDFEVPAELEKKFSDFEGTQNALKQRMDAVEAAARAGSSDREAFSKSAKERIAEVEAKAAVAESAKIKDALEKVEKLVRINEKLEKAVQGLVDKNLRDGDVAEGLRSLTLRLEKMEERLTAREAAEKDAVYAFQPPIIIEDASDDAPSATSILSWFTCTQCVERKKPTELPLTKEQVKAEVQSFKPDAKKIDVIPEVQSFKPDAKKVDDPERGVRSRTSRGGA